MNMTEIKSTSISSDNTPTVVVLLATYQGINFIKAQLDSILSQTFSSLQIIISDDGSTDGTREFLEQYQRDYPNQIVLKHRPEYEHRKPQNFRIPEPARNFFWLMSQTNADYVLLSDQDDVWISKKVEILLERMKIIEAPGVPALVYSDMNVVDASLHLINPSFFSYSHCNPKRTSLSEILVENPVTGGSLMMNRALLKLCSRIPQACFMHDWWIALCASSFGVISYVSQPLSMYRQHLGNVLGASKNGSLKDLLKRCHRQNEVQNNYCLMFFQAAAFKKEFHNQLDESQLRILRAFLALPSMTPYTRFKIIVRYGFFKSSWFQTVAQAFTIPSR